MKRHRNRRVIYLPAFLVVSLLLSSQALACLFPSLQEMNADQPMACCAKSCRIDPTPAEARKACEQSRLALSPRPAITSQVTIALPATAKELPASALCSVDETSSHTFAAAARATDERRPSHQQGTKLYLLTHSLLI